MLVEPIVRVALWISPEARPTLLFCLGLLATLQANLASHVSQSLRDTMDEFELAAHAVTAFGAVIRVPVRLGIAI
jgi:hypothetical protein